MSMPRPEVRGAVAISGIYDLEPIRLSCLNEKLGLDTAEAERNSPVRHLPATAGELVPGNCPNCAASRSSMPGRGPNGVFRDACCRWTALTTSRFWTRWRDRKAF
jgi:hypothetical protein